MSPICGSLSVPTVLRRKDHYYYSSLNSSPQLARDDTDSLISSISTDTATHSFSTLPNIAELANTGEELTEDRVNNTQLEDANLNNIMG